VRALVIEDDLGVAAFITRGMRENRFSVDHAANGTEGFELASREAYDVIVLDLMLPGMDGFEIVRELRQKELCMPVICLTARDALDDRIRGLDLGADDYLSKPFSFAELLARIRALLRRGALATGSPYVIDELSVDVLTRTVLRAGRRVELSIREFSLLEFMVRHRGQVVSRSMILKYVWDMNHDPQSNVVDVHINRLRRKIDQGRNESLIQTIRGVGYVLGG